MNTGGANQFKVLFKNLLFDSIVCQKSLPTRSHSLPPYADRIHHFTQKEHVIFKLKILKDT